MPTRRRSNASPLRPDPVAGAILALAVASCGGKTDLPPDRRDIRDADTVRPPSVTCTADAGESVPITVGSSYGHYLVKSIDVTSGASCGAYAFVYDGPFEPTRSLTATVALQRNGTNVLSIQYDWQTTVSDERLGLTYTFVFRGYFAITVRNSTSGTLNLWGMPQSIFDGTHVVLVGSK